MSYILMKYLTLLELWSHVQTVSPIFIITSVFDILSLLILLLLTSVTTLSLSLCTL